MKNKILWAALAALMVLTLLGGCQLAVPDDGTGDGTDAGQDKLCGAFITLDYLNISEPYITINWKGEPEFSYPESRLYATRTEDENGYNKYAFEDAEGFSYFIVRMQSPDGYGSYSTSYADGPIQAGGISISDNDLSLSCTICFDVHAYCEVYVNPVYQTPDGEVYTVPGDGMSFGSIYEGDVGSTTYSTTNTETINGETVTSTNEVTVSITGCNTVQKAVLKQMDENDQIVDEAVITQDSIPESIRVLPDTAYMMLEEHSIDREGNAVVKRTLVDTSEGYFYVQFTGEHGIVVPSMVTLEHSGQ